VIERPSEALILAGGLGTRLRPVVAGLPKALAPIGGRPFLEFLLDYWLGQGIECFVLSVGWLAERIVTHLGDNYKGAAVEYVREAEPLGTGGALALAFKQAAWRGRHVLVLNGDTWLPASLARLAEAAENSSRPIILALVKAPKDNRYGGDSLEPGGRVSRFGLPAAEAPAFINAGCYLLEQEMVGRLLAGRPARFSLEDDFLGPLAGRGLVGGVLEEAGFIDIGVPEDYLRFVAAREQKGH